MTLARKASQTAWQIQDYLQRSDTAAAADLAFLNIDAATTHPRLAQMCLLALTRAGDLTHAVDLADELAKAPQPPELAQSVAQTFFNAGRHEDALAAALPALEEAQGMAAARLHFVIGQSLMARGDGAEQDALPHIEAAHSALPDNVPILRLYGDLLLQTGRYEEAVTILGRAAEKAPQLATVQRLYARALKHAQRYEEAGAVMARAAALGVSAEKDKRLATSALLQAGREEEGRAVYDSMLKERSAKLKLTLKEELASLYDRLDEARLSQARLDWAWHLASHALGRAPAADRAAWEREARWGLLADMALMNWLECRPDARDEPLALLDGIDRLRQVISSLTAGGKGALLAAAHIGTMFAGPLAMTQTQARYKWLSSTPRISTANYADSLISTSDQTETQVARRIREALRDGCLVTIAADGSMSPVAPRLEWRGASVTYSTFTSAVVYKTGTPSMFTAPYWKDQSHIDFILNPLPQPEDGETLEAFNTRWREAYFAEISNFMTLGPRNLRLTGGIWRHV